MTGQTNEAPVTLHIAATESVSLSAALEAVAPFVNHDDVVLAWGPSRVLIDTFEHAVSSTAFERERVFEARVFGQTGELRWLQRGVGTQSGAVAAATGSAAWLTEGMGSPEGWRPVELRTAVVETIERTYLCWGEIVPHRSDGSWTALSSSRIGEYRLPVAAARGQQVLLHAVEYVGRGPHGNALILNERLIGLRSQGVLS